MAEAIKPINKKRFRKNIQRVFDAGDLYRVIRSHGQKVQYRYFEDGQLKELTYEDFADMIRNIAGAFAHLKLCNKRIAVIGDTSPQWLAAYVATIACGATVIPMDKELALNEIEKFLTGVKADAIVYSKSFNEKFVATIQRHPTIKYFIPINAEYDGSFNKKIIPFSEIIEIGERESAAGYEVPVKTDRTRLCEFLFTSGTTGTSKCVMLNQKNIYSVVNAAAETVNFTCDDTVVSVLPVHHTYELACLQAEMVLGCTTCINDSLRHVMKNFVLFKPTALVLVPMFLNTMYKKIWSEAEKTGKAGLLRASLAVSRKMMLVGIDIRRTLFKTVIDAFGGRLEKVICGGAKLDPTLIAKFEEFGISIFEGFGITECSPLAAVTPYYARKYGSVGPAVPCCSVRIKSKGEKNEYGFDVGEIQVKGDNVMIGYYRNPEANAEVFTADGWFRTGDIGYMDRDGYIYITGRLKSVIVLENGKNVFPEEIEEYLGGIEKICECVVVGRKAPDSDSIILTAVVYPELSKFEEGSTDEQIIEILRSEINNMNRKLPGFKQVRAVEIRREEFEKTTSRKIKRHLIK